MRCELWKMHFIAVIGHARHTPAYIYTHAYSSHRSERRSLLFFFHRQVNGTCIKYDFRSVRRARKREKEGEKTISLSVTRYTLMVCSVSSNNIFSSPTLSEWKVTSELYRICLQRHLIMVNRAPYIISFAGWPVFIESKQTNNKLLPLQSLVSISFLFFIHLFFLSLVPDAIAFNLGDCDWGEASQANASNLSINKQMHQSTCYPYTFIIRFNSRLISLSQ